MGHDDANEGAGLGECPGHVWVPDGFDVVEREGLVGMAITNRCRCGAVFYEPSNVDQWPGGLDPRLQ